MPDHNDFFRRVPYEEHYADQMRELPSEEIKVRIRLNQIEIDPSQLNRLTTELWNDYNMDLSRSNSNRDIIIVSSIPPDNNFGEHEVMEVIRKYAQNAEVVREPPQPAQVVQHRR